MPGVLASAPGTRVPGAYPLVSLTYGATAPTALTQPEATDYAKLIRYAVGPGQVPGTNPGQLPDGYVPLPQPLRAQALLAATIVQERKGGTPPVPATPDRASGLPGGRSSTTGGVGGVGGFGSGDGGGGSLDPGAGGVADSGGINTGSGGTNPAADLAASPATANGRNALATGDGTQPPTIAAGERTPSERVGAAPLRAADRPRPRCPGRSRRPGASTCEEADTSLNP